MTTVEQRPEDTADNDKKPCGYGRMLRKEDPRFIRGRGNYVDDVQLPGMLHLAILRSPYAHATIKGIDTTAAQAHPKVKAVITGADLAEKGLAWMPTLSNDVQAVLATDKVRFQGTGGGVRRRRGPVLGARCPGAHRRRLRTARPGDRRAHGAGPIGAGDPHRPRGQDRQPLASTGRPATPPPPTPCSPRPMWSSNGEIVYPRVHPAPMETCGAVADLDPVSGKLTLWCTTQAPHAHRTVYALVAGLPEHKIRIVAPDIGGGFGNKVPIYPDTSAPSSRRWCWASR